MYVEEHDQLEMEDIYNELPDIEETARRVTRSTDEKAMRKGNLLKLKLHYVIVNLLQNP